MRNNLRFLTIMYIPLMFGVNYTVYLFFGWLAFGLTLWVSLSLWLACVWALIFGDWSEDE
ncbi:hypothetical protein CPT_Moonbeam148 [Bacillus phage Moonbeam]|uniref:Uncharacterized protein n=1 Tax=Bacillus phage Moonbeam TaxID=1540091 RepID=A0A0A0RSN8_9CAUD|nr:hypothetical protein CPT_Moonbeam148 [Bacillus phage Moonbeam]AIW03546.1 hypothetical protein CPT_Moonbeam148 [Bacillus phage Moonbeam]